MIVRGLDLSHWQATVDFSRMAREGVSFVMLKATDGASYVDPTFVDRLAAARAAGLSVGAYHFCRPGGDVSAQVDNLLSVAGDVKVLAADIEVDDGQPIDRIAPWAAAFLHVLERRSGRIPFVYTSPSYANLRNLGRLVGDEYPLWIAHWTTKNTPALPAGWSGWRIWQFTNSGNVAGISPVDVNLSDDEVWR